MRVIGASILTLVLTAGCAGSGATQSTSSSVDTADEAASAPNRTLVGVAKVVCESAVERVRGPETGRSTEKIARCGDTDVRLFQSAAARDSWVKVARGFGPVLVGTNWAVASNQRVLEVAKPKLGGRIVWPGIGAEPVDANFDDVNDWSFADIECRHAYHESDERKLLRTCLANGGH